MQAYPQIQYTPNRLWQECDAPLLRMAQEADAYTPDGLMPESGPAAAPRVKDSRSGFLRQVSLLLVFGVLCLAAYYVTSRYVVTPVVIQGRSMTPTTV